jgi:hypothetical protein
MSDVLTRVRVHDYMDGDGHTSFGWDETDDEWVIPMIRRKMAQGFVFWIVKRNPLREIRLERVADIGDSRHVIIRDEAARTLFEQGRIALASDDDENDVVRLHRAESAEEAASHDAVAHRRLAGG